MGCFFAMNLFVGVIIDNFNRIQAEADGEGSATRTREQQQWVDTMKNAARAQPVRAVRPPGHACRKLLYRLVTSAPFDSFIIGVQTSA